jgi:2-polyprenyl-6-methoxyphenol hydroxylase-like FAD-dependent oxidoreductase
MVRIAIIGGGIGGLTTAIALRHFGFEPEVYEQAPVLLDVGAAIAIWPNAMRVIERLGLAEQVLERAGVMKEVRWLDQNGRLINRVSIAETSDRKGPQSVALHRADLQEILLNALPSTSVHLGNSLIECSQNNDKVVAQFSNGNIIEADFLIGADGIHSDVRTKLLDDRPPTYRGYMVWRGISPVALSAIPPNTAIELHGAGKRFGIGPVGLGRTGWWASANGPNINLKSEERNADRKTWKQGESIASNLPHDTQKELLRLFDGWFRPVLQLIEATPSASILRTGAFDRRANKNWGAKRISLLGDAIHPMTPNFGQGGCMAIEDALIFARCLQVLGAEQSALRHYQQLRYRRTAAVTRYSRMYGTVGQWENVFARGFRRAFFSLVPETVARRMMQIVFDYNACEIEV